MAVVRSKQVLTRIEPSGLNATENTPDDPFASQRSTSRPVTASRIDSPVPPDAIQRPSGLNPRLVPSQQASLPPLCHILRPDRRSQVTISRLLIPTARNRPSAEKAIDSGNPSGAGNDFHATESVATSSRKSVTLPEHATAA